jgi:hypothetical protein
MYNIKNISKLSHRDFNQSPLCALSRISQQTVLTIADRGFLPFSIPCKCLLANILLIPSLFPFYSQTPRISRLLNTSRSVRTLLMLRAWPRWRQVLLRTADQLPSVMVFTVTSISYKSDLLMVWVSPHTFTSLSRKKLVIKHRHPDFLIAVYELQQSRTSCLNPLSSGTSLFHFISLPFALSSAIWGPLAFPRHPLLPETAKPPPSSRTNAAFLFPNVPRVWIPQFSRDSDWDSDSDSDSDSNSNSGSMFLSLHSTPIPILMTLQQ